MPRSTRTAARHGAYKLEHLLGALTKLVPILLGGARTTSRQASLERRSRNAARTESELLARHHLRAARGELQRQCVQRLSLYGAVQEQGAAQAAGKGGKVGKGGSKAKMEGNRARRAMTRQCHGSCRRAHTWAIAGGLPTRSSRQWRLRDVLLQSLRQAPRRPPFGSHVGFLKPTKIVEETTLKSI